MILPDSADLVREGHDQLAEWYLEARDQWQSMPHLDRLLARLHPGSRILNVRCGAGIPIDSYLAEKGYDVIGVDISPRQVELAVRNRPYSRSSARGTPVCRHLAFKGRPEWLHSQSQV